MQNQQLNYNELIDAIVAWGRDKNITNARKQYLKYCEEKGELCGHYLRKNQNALVDDLGDVVVTLTILADIMGVADALKTSFRGNVVSTEQCLLNLELEVVNAMCDFITHRQGEYEKALLHSRFRGIALHLKSLAMSLHLDLTYCVASAYTEIAARKGRTIGGTFIKSSDL